MKKTNFITKQAMIAAIYAVVSLALALKLSSQVQQSC